MKRFVLVCASVIAWAGSPRAASAELPAWCGKASFETTGYDLNDLKRSEPDYVVRAIAKTRCSESPEVVQHHAKIDAARAAWGKKLGMVDADWADAVAFIDNRDGNFPKVEYSTKLLAELTPMDQWRAIREGLEVSGKGFADPLYVADALNGQLTEVGRLAFLEWCLGERVGHDAIGHWAICQGDAEQWDLAKFAAQLRADTAHDGGTKMLLRFRAVELGTKLKEVAGQLDKLFKQDAEYKKLFGVAAKARADWSAGVGARADLLGLVQAMESATFAGSRKQFAGCEQKTADALAAAIAAIPAKAFDGMADVRDDPFRGFAYAAGPVIVNNPVANLAATAFALCHKTATADWLRATLQEVPGVRGPRSAALGALYNEKFEFDDVDAREPRYPEIRSRPYARIGGAVSSAGGVVAKVKMEKEFANVALKKTTAKRLSCVKSKPTNRLSRIRSDGTIEYESVCLKSAVVTYDTTWSDFKINPAHVPLLKTGAKFSSVYGDKFADVIAIWPNANATRPSILLGAKLK